MRQARLVFTLDSNYETFSSDKLLRGMFQIPRENDPEKWRTVSHAWVAIDQSLLQNKDALLLIESTIGHLLQTLEEVTAEERNNESIADRDVSFVFAVNPWPEEFLARIDKRVAKLKEVKEETEA